MPAGRMPPNYACGLTAAAGQQQGPGAVMFAVGLKGRVFDNDDYDDGRRDCDFQVHLHPSL